MTTSYALTVDFPSLPLMRRRIVGIDSLVEDLARAVTATGSDNYPPYNIIKNSGTNYTIEVAVAGFNDDELTVELHENVLTVSGARAKEVDVAEVEYIHRGIGKRDFTRKMTLVEHMEVTGASVKNGILRIDIEQRIPEEKKPKRIDITTNK